MAGPVGVRADPLEQLVVAGHRHDIETASPYHGILVTTETAHVHRFLVEEDTGVGPSNRSNSHRQSVDVGSRRIFHRYDNLQKSVKLFDAGQKKAAPLHSTREIEKISSLAKVSTRRGSRVTSR